METLIEQDQFVAVFDFALGEVTNHLNGSVVSAGPSRLEGLVGAACRNWWHRAQAT